MHCPSCHQERLIPETALHYQGHPADATLYHCGDCRHLLLHCPREGTSIVLDLSAFSRATHGTSLEAWVREQLAQPA